MSRRSHRRTTSTTSTTVSTPSERTREGRTAATRIGISVELYKQERGAGRLWCSACRTFHAETEFNVDRSRSTGRQARCRKSRRPIPSAPEPTA